MKTRQFAWLVAIVVVVAACASPAVSPTPSPTPLVTPKPTPNAIDHVLATLDDIEGKLKAFALIAGADVPDAKSIYADVKTIAIAEQAWLATSDLDDFVKRRYENLLSALTYLDDPMDTASFQTAYVKLVLPEVMKTLSEVRDRALAR